MIKSNIPEQEPIEFISYYPEFEGWYLNCEMDSKKWCCKNIKKGWNIIDIGANIGCYSILFSRLVGENGIVWAIEPTETYNMLKENIEYNKFTHIVKTFNIAFGSNSGKIEDGIYRIWGNVPETQVYDFITLDDFIKQESIERLDLIKIDTDSFDFEILKGGIQTLEKFSPFVLVELLDDVLKLRGFTLSEALKWIKDQNYNYAYLGEGNWILRRN